MAKVSTNEREWQGEVLAWFRSALHPPFTEVTQETGVSGQFPDIIFWADRHTNHAFVSCELKGTETSARNPDLLTNAIEKCENLGTKVLLTWNMTEAIVWSVRFGVAQTLWYYAAIDVPNTKEWRKKHSELESLAKTITKPQWEFPRLCRGGIKSLTYPAVRGGPGCLNRVSASISGASAGVRLPSGVAAG
jgi:hypothetical protein